MALTRDEKAQLIAEYTEKVSRAEAAYIADYRGLTVKEIGEFRAEFRKTEAVSELEIGKNTLFRIAFENAGWAVPLQYLEGPTAVLICYDDPAAPATVSYTHLDVYKRQPLQRPMPTPTSSRTRSPELHDI